MPHISLLRCGIELSKLRSLPGRLFGFLRHFARPLLGAVQYPQYSYSIADDAISRVPHISILRCGVAGPESGPLSAALGVFAKLRRDKNDRLLIGEGRIHRQVTSHSRHRARHR